MSVQHMPIEAGGRTLATLRALALMTTRHENVIRKHCVPVACQVARSRTKSPVMLYDADECDRILRRAERRFRRVA